MYGKYQETIAEWLYQNRNHIIESSKSIIDAYNSLLKTEESVFFQEITKQFSIRLREHIAIEAGKALGYSAGDIMECLEDLNLELYMNGDNK